MNRVTNKIQSNLGCAAVCLAGLLWPASAAADIALTDPAKTDGWVVSMDGQVNAYLSWVFGQTTNMSGTGASLNPNDPNDPSNRYLLVGPQFGITGNPTPSGAVLDTVQDTDISAPRVRSGYASTILGFKVSKQVSDWMKVSFRLAIWAGIQNGQVGGVRQQNDAAAADFRDQYVQIEGPWGMAWAGRRLGLYNRGGTRMDFYLVHQEGVGNPCNVDSGGTAACGNTGVGSMFPNRNAQLGYATPEVAHMQLNVAIFDPSMIDTTWNRTPSPRIEAEATYHREGDNKEKKDEMNAWVNGLAQQIARVQETPPNPLRGEAGIPANSVRQVWGVGGGAWGRAHGFAIGATGWYGVGLGTATPFGNTAIDEHGTLRKHFGYLGAVNYRLGNFEVAGSYGSSNCIETDWDSDPTNGHPISVIKQVRGIAAKVAYHLGPVVFSVDGMNLHYTWHRGEKQTANVVSGGMSGAF